MRWSAAQVKYVSTRRAYLKFSERYGYRSVRELIQLESMDEPLRNCLWSLLKVHVWDRVDNPYHSHTLVSDQNRPIKTLCIRIWLHYFKHPLDTLGDDWRKVLSVLRDYFFSCQWYEIYDFLEFVITAPIYMIKIIYKDYISKKNK